ncbi:MAG: polysaccharide pyruvyl transferase family protein, partial [bacterium]
MVSRKSFPGVLEAVRGSDALVVGGGSLLQDVTSFRSLAYYVSILRWALFWGKPILFYGCGLGPLRRFLSRFMVSQVLRRSFLILRDEESQDLALRLRASPSQVFLGADPVFALGDLEGRRQSGSRKVAVFLRPVDGWPEE